VREGVGLTGCRSLLRRLHLIRSRSRLPLPLLPPVLLLPLSYSSTVALARRRGLSTYHSGDNRKKRRRFGATSCNREADYTRPSVQCLIHVTMFLVQYF